MDPITEIFAAFGSPAKLARATGIAAQTVHDWKGKGKPNIPSWRRPVILAALRSTDAKVSAETLAYLGAPSSPRRERGADR